MKKHPTPILLLLCTILLIGGTAVAYCNTRSFGFEPDAKWITYNDGGFTVYDFRVEYRQLAPAISPCPAASSYPVVPLT